MERDADIVVVGGGVVGLAAARALARQRRRPLLLEQLTVGHDRGSSHGTSRIFRLSYPDAHVVRMAQSALPLWRELEAETGDALLVATGALDIGPAFAPNRSALAACGAPSQPLDAAETAERFGLTLPEGTEVLLQPDGGYLHSDRCLAALRTSAEALGAELVEGETVLALADEGRRVRVTTASGDVTAAAVVVAAGAWAPSLLETAGIVLPVVATRETLAYFELAGDAPPPLVDSTTPAAGYGPARTGNLTYALPAPGVGLKVGLHHAGPPADPDARGEVDEAIVGWTTDWVAARVPAASPVPIRAETCLYTNTADESFVLERHGRIVVGSACSGHGFKFAPLVGRTLAALALEAGR